MVHGENPIKMDDLGVPPFQEMPICIMVIYHDSDDAELLLWINNLPWIQGWQMSEFLQLAPAHQVVNPFNLKNRIGYNPGAAASRAAMSCP